MKKFLICCFIALTTMMEAQEKLPEVAKIFPESVIESWGYRTIKIENAEQGEWEVQQFGQAVVRHQSIKAIKEIKGEIHTYFRFRIAEETFSTSEQAKKRIDRIRELPPGLDTKKAPNWVLCKGLAVGKVAYIVSTDSVKVEREGLPGLMKLLSAKVAAR